MLLSGSVTRRAINHDARTPTAISTTLKNARVRRIRRGSDKTSLIGTSIATTRGVPAICSSAERISPTPGRDIIGGTLLSTAGGDAMRPASVVHAEPSAFL